MDWINLFSVLASLATGLGLGVLTKSGRLKNKAEAMNAMNGMYEARIKDLHASIEVCNNTEREHVKRISELNKVVDDKTDRIRKISDDLYSSQLEVNRANDRIIALTEQRDAEKAKKEYYKRWRCEKSTCLDPDGRIPPNSKLKSETFKSPEE